MENSNKENIKKLTLSRVLAYLFGAIFLLAGVTSLFSNFMAGIVFIVISIILFPPLYKLLESKTKVRLSKSLRVVTTIILLGVAGVLLSDNEADSVVEKVNQESISTTTENTPSVKERDTQESSATEKQQEEKQITTNPEAPKQEQVYSPTLGERQALLSAKKYLNYTGFSRKGLIKQLEFEGFSNKEAIYGVDNSNADWNAQAAISAKNYIEYTSFSRSGLIEQLEFEGYTRQQAEYGANAVGY